MTFAVDRQPAQHAMRIVRGDDLTITVPIFQADGTTPQVTTGWAGAAMLRTPATAEIGLAGTVDVDTLGGSGQVVVRFGRGVTAAAVPGDGVWDLELIDNDDVKQTPVAGALTILADATYG